MNFVATYDERYDKSPFFGAFEELCRSGIELKKNLIKILSQENPDTK